jgi:two-component system NarL family sensor kinase
MCDRFQSTSSIPIIFREFGDTPSLPRTRELMLFRIIQEVLNNGMKHAQASTLQVTFENKDCLVVTVEDDGQGFEGRSQKDEKTPDKGLGLFNIDNRARLAGGTVDLQSVPGRGTKIIITVPYENI